eukprot:m.392761 g.392761  ORF g.392761 m.392761 type:complete len:508 (-) comp20088_c0_seq1:35-1558(-)
MPAIHDHEQCGQTCSCVARAPAAQEPCRVRPSTPFWLCLHPHGHRRCRHGPCGRQRHHRCPHRHCQNHQSRYASSSSSCPCSCASLAAWQPTGSGCQAANDSPAPSRCVCDVCVGGGGVSVETVSDFGTSRRRCFANEHALAKALCDALPVEVFDCCVHVQAEPQGQLAFLSRLEHDRQRLRGQLLCTRCGRFYQGKRGLCHHMRIRHGETYEYSVKEADSAKLLVVAFEGDAAASSVLKHRQDQWRTTQQQQDQLRARGRGSGGGGGGGGLPHGLVAARDGDVACLQQLVSNGWDPRTCFDRNASSALHWAAGSGCIEACDFLIHTCNVPLRQLQQRDGRNALHWAARNGHLEMCKWLVNEGLDVNEGTRDGTPPFHWAAWQGHHHVCQWLAFEAGADFHAVNVYGCNAFQWAAQEGNVKMCQWLLDIGLDVTVINRNGHSAVHKAALKGQLDACKWLLDTAKLGVKHLAPDRQGNTPSKMARLEGHTAVADWLDQRNATLEPHHQ